MKNIVEAFRPERSLSDNDAWELFRLAAFGETIGWSLLIIGVLCEKLPVAWGQYPVHFFGAFHGALFIGYIVSVCIVFPSLKWGALQTLIAGLCSVPPYGSFIYERYVAWHRHHQQFTRLRSSILIMQLVDTDQ